MVQLGDTLSQIAARLRSSTDHQAKHNGLADPDLSYSGQIFYSNFPKEDHEGGGNTMVEDLAFGEEATAFDAAVANNSQIGEAPP
ncbi:MAG TPA: LysM peptidoglycan-binding domain-containing protein [Rubrobacteraceae bacterium]|nr:LysM peptidoglycan-binding domain-containing protein [Rubrobacteraceae bacterium]